MLPQVKKTERRSAIQAAALSLFAARGYTATSMADIARQAGTTTANLYVYFPSKLALLYDVYRPWLLAHLAALEGAVRCGGTPRTRLMTLFTGLWSGIPSADNCFANTLIEALAGVPAQTGKTDTLLHESEAWLAALLLDCLPAGRRAAGGDPLLAHVAWMAFDGFVINRRLGDVRDVQGISERLTSLLLGDAASARADPPLPEEGAGH